MAKKKKRRSTRPPGVDPNEQRRERLEARRRAKAEAEAARRRKQQRQKWMWRGVFLLLALGVFWFLFLRGGRPDAIAGHELETFSETGVQEHSDQPQTYEMTPPVQGTHAATPASCGVYSEPIPNENLVHTLEHGAVGLLYRPDLALENIRALEKLVDEDHIFSAPYAGPPAMKTPIAAVSWGEMMRLEELDVQALEEYIDTFRGKGPEDQDCPLDQDSPFEPPEPSPEPTADTTPAGGGNEGGNKNEDEKDGDQG